METITRSRVVLNRNTFPGAIGNSSEIPDQFEVFEARFHGTDEVFFRVSIRHNEWLEMGSPEQITANVTPGNALGADTRPARD